MNLLISDKIATPAIDLLKEKGINLDYLPDISSQILIEKIALFDGLIVRSRTKVTADVISAGKNLKIIGRAGSGVDNIDIEAAKKRKITVVNTPEANSEAVAELTIGLIINLIRHIHKAHESMKRGEWEKKMFSGTEISGKKVGIIGYGHIGKKVARILSSFGAEILYFGISERNANYETIFSSADIISIHLPLNKQTQNLIDKKFLSMMKKDAYLINTSRGKVMDEDYFYGMLVENKIKGAALDVFWEEPLPSDSKWRKLSNVILTPHIGAATSEALTKAGMCVAEDILRVVNHQKPLYRVI